MMRRLCSAALVHGHGEAAADVVFVEPRPGRTAHTRDRPAHDALRPPDVAQLVLEAGRGDQDLARLQFPNRQQGFFLQPVDVLEAEQLVGKVVLGLVVKAAVRHPRCTA